MTECRSEGTVDGKRIKRSPLAAGPRRRHAEDTAGGARATVDAGQRVAKWPASSLLERPGRPMSVTHVAGQKCYPCSRLHIQPYGVALPRVGGSWCGVVSSTKGTPHSSSGPHPQLSVIPPTRESAATMVVSSLRGRLRPPHHTATMGPRLAIRTGCQPLQTLT